MSLHLPLRSPCRQGTCFQAPGEEGQHGFSLGILKFALSAQDLLPFEDRVAMCELAVSASGIGSLLCEWCVIISCERVLASESCVSMPW